MSSTAGPVIDSDDGGIRTVATLVAWKHRSAGPALSLVRLISRQSPAPDVVVLSELAASSDAAGLTSDFGGAATAAADRLAQFGDVAAAIWYAHHGDFASADAAGAAETLTEVHLEHVSGRYQCDLADHRLLSEAETIGVLEDLRMSPVTAVLATLDAHR